MDNMAVIDLGLNGTLPSDSNRLASVGKEIKQALSTTGLCYLTNHGIDATLVTLFHEETLKLFQEPKERKLAFASSDGVWPYGWLGFDDKVFNPEEPPDIKELFGYVPGEEVPHVWPDGYEEVTKMMFSAFTDLCYKVLEMLSYGLGLNANFMKDAHSLIDQKGNHTTLRTHYYPPLPNNFIPAKNQLRCFEHTDYGTITLLAVQDGDGGLEVLKPGPKPGYGFVPVKPLPGSIIMMAGSLLQRWTSDNIIAPTHRVAVPNDTRERSSCRQSTAFFVAPDDETIVRCFDGLDKYEPIKTIYHLRKRANKSHITSRQ